MRIQYTKIIDSEIVLVDTDTVQIIRGCFDTCIKEVQKKVDEFISDEKRWQLTIPFDEFKVRLRKRL